MAVSHVEDYFKQVCDQYIEMRQNILELEEEAKKNLIEPERVDALKEVIKPLMENYERWSYMMYLLHKPQRPEKEKAYQKRNKKFLQGLSQKNSPQSKLAEGRTVIENLKNHS